MRGASGMLNSYLRKENLKYIDIRCLIISSFKLLIISNNRYSLNTAGKYSYRNFDDMLDTKNRLCVVMYSQRGGV
jgi:hypothetical protein